MVPASWQLANVAGLGPSEQMRKDMMKRHSKAHSEDRRKVVQGPEMTTEDVLHGKDTDQDESCYTKATAKSIDALKHPCISPSMMPPNSKVTAKLPLLSLHILNEQKARHSDLGLDFRESGTPIRLLPSGVTRVWTWGAVQVRVTVRAIAMGVVTIMDTPTGRVGGRRVLRSQMTTLL